MEMWDRVPWCDVMLAVGARNPRRKRGGAGLTLLSLLLPPSGSAGLSRL